MRRDEAVRVHVARGGGQARREGEAKVDVGRVEGRVAEVVDGKGADEGLEEVAVGRVVGCEAVFVRVSERVRVREIRRTWSQGVPEEPEGKGVLARLGGPVVGAVASVPETVEDVALYEVREAGVAELRGVETVVLEIENESAVEVVDDDGAAADALEGLAVADELGGEDVGVGGVVWEAALCSGVVKLCPKNASVEMGVAGYGEVVVEEV